VKVADRRMNRKRGIHESDCREGTGDAGETSRFVPLRRQFMPQPDGRRLRPRLAEDAETEEEALTHYRRVRDDIRCFVQFLPDTLGRNMEEK